jgi:hypothetical protein
MGFGASIFKHQNMVSMKKIYNLVLSISLFYSAFLHGTSWSPIWGFDLLEMVSMHKWTSHYMGTQMHIYYLVLVLWSRLLFTCMYAWLEMFVPNILMHRWTWATCIQCAPKFLVTPLTFYFIFQKCLF